MEPEQARTLAVAALRHFSAGVLLLQTIRKHGYRVREKQPQTVIAVSVPSKEANPSRLRELKMPFGKFIGTPVAELPDSYVRWAYSVDWIKNPLRRAIEEEWTRRFSGEAKRKWR